MFDSPKAVHFDAFLRGKGKLADHDPVGLEYRWGAAATVQREVTSDMLRLTTTEINDIQQALQRCNGKRDIVVTLRGYGEECAVQ